MLLRAWQLKLYWEVPKWCWKLAGTIGSVSRVGIKLSAVELSVTQNRKIVL